MNVAEERKAVTVTHDGVKPLSMSSNGISIQSEKIFEKLNRKPISASLITGLEGCHARWAFQSFLESELFPVSGDTPALKGQLFHSAMEELFKLPQSEREKERLEDIVENLLNDKDNYDYHIYKEREDVLLWLKESIDNYYSMGGNPKKIRIAEIESNGQKKMGLEVAVDGKIFEEQGRRAFGFIDRLSLDEDGESLIVEDWKSGKAKKWSGKVGKEGWAEQRQQILYSMLLEGKGYRVSKARLIYPYAKHIEKVDVLKKDSREAVIDDVKTADSKLKVLSDTNTFGFDPQFCDFCPLAKICQSPRKMSFAYKSEKCANALASQPSAEELSKGIDIL